MVRSIFSARARDGVARRAWHLGCLAVPVFQPPSRQGAKSFRGGALGVFPIRWVVRRRGFGFLPLRLHALLEFLHPLAEIRILLFQRLDPRFELPLLALGYFGDGVALDFHAAKETNAGIGDAFVTMPIHISDGELIPAWDLFPHPLAVAKDSVIARGLRLHVQDVATAAFDVIVDSVGVDALDELGDAEPNDGDHKNGTDEVPICENVEEG